MLRRMTSGTMLVCIKDTSEDINWENEVVKVHLYDTDTSSHSLWCSSGTVRWRTLRQMNGLEKESDGIESKFMLFTDLTDEDQFYYKMAGRLPDKCITQYVG